MKIPHPIKEYRAKKEAERRRKEAEAREQRKKALKIGVPVFIALLILAGIGSLTEEKQTQPTEPTSQIQEVTEAPATPDPSEIIEPTTTIPDTTESTSTEPANTEPATQETSAPEQEPSPETTVPEPSTPVIDLNNIPEYSGKPYVEINGNVPSFTDAELTTTSFEKYSSLESLGRCGVAYACIGQDIMPTKERGSIGQVKPSGWKTVKYNGVVDGNYLYNRCHLIGYQLTGENANERNLITGTRYLNVEGMLPFENMVADFVKETGNHVMYRVTPVFEGNNLVASGVLMEAKSVEDNGDGILFNVFCYNVQPDITIDYATGESSLNEGAVTETPAQESTAPAVSQGSGESTEVSKEATYILNTNTRKFHNPTCSSAADIKASNKQEFTGSRDDLISQGYQPCKRCNP